MNKWIVCLVVCTGMMILWVVKKVRTTVATTAPVGYEDEAGFHFGAPSMEE